jgi:hypothetical protein
MNEPILDRVTFDSLSLKYQEVIVNPSVWQITDYLLGQPSIDLVICESHVKFDLTQHTFNDKFNLSTVITLHALLK